MARVLVLRALRLVTARIRERTMPEEIRTAFGSILLVSSSDYRLRNSAEHAEAVADVVAEDEHRELSPEGRAELVEALTTGAVALVRLRRAPRVLDRPKFISLIEPDARPEREDDRPRPTWVELALRGPHGETFPEAMLRVRLPGGEIRVERIRDDSTWRADDVAEQGTCHVELIEAGPRTRAQGQPGSPNDAVVIRPGGPSVGLVAGRKHELLVRRPLHSFSV